jgi:RHS repeat-associated protein
MGEAARLGDPIVHTSALAGFLVGAVIGVALIAAVAFATFTCGFGVALLAGLVAGIGASAILGIGEAIGKMFSSPSGAITLGSRNVFVNSRNAAHVQASTVACSKHSPTPLVAEGSTNVFINSLACARKGDAITCGAKIDDGSPDTFIGGGTHRYLEVDDEVPPWLRTTVDWAFALAGLVGGLGGLLKQAGGLSRAVLPCAAKFIGGFVLGEAAGRYVIGPTVQRVFGGLFGRPVDVTTGRKVLLAQDEVDYVLASPLPLEIARFYASNLAHEGHAGTLGPGWLLPWEQRLERRAGRLRLVDAQGRESGFPNVQPGHVAFHDAEQKWLACTVQGRYILYDLTETYFDFGEMDEGDADDTVHLQRIEDRCGQGLAFHRHPATQRVERIETSARQLLRLSYLNPKGRLTAIELQDDAPSGKRERIVEYRYDDAGRLIGVLNAQGHQTRRFEYTATGLTSGLTSGLMNAHVNALGFTCRYEWADIAGLPRVVACSTSEGEQAHFTYNLHDRRTRVRDELGRCATWTYDEQHQITECIDLDGARYAADYNDAGLPTVLHLPGEAGQPRTVAFEYDQAGRIVGETDPLGRTTTTRYRANSLRPEAVTLPDGAQWRVDYDFLGRVLATTDPLGRIDKQRYPEGSPSPWPIARTDARGADKHLEWDRRGQLTSYTDCSGKTTRYAYDHHGRLTSVTNALDETVHMRRLATGQLVEVTLPDGSTEGFEHDAAGLLVQHRDRAGHTRAWQRNARGQPIVAIDANERRLKYEYDPRGRLVALQSGTHDEAATYRFAYDAGDRLAQETRPDGIERHLRYGAFGQLVEQRTVGSWVGGEPSTHASVTSSTSHAHQVRPERASRFERDPMGRLLAHTNATAITRYTWDAGDRLTQAQRQPTDAGAATGVNPDTVAFSYDKAGRLLTEQGAHGTVAYELDALDNLSALTLPDGQRLDYLSYGSGHVHQIRSGEQVIADFERDDLHREVVRTQGRLTHAVGYDALGRRTWQSAGSRAAASGQAPLPGQGALWRTWRYSAEGEVAEQRDSLRGSVYFQHDEAGHLLKRSRSDATLDTGYEAFAWDAAGNLLAAAARGAPSGTSGTSAGRVEGNRLVMWQDLRLSYDPWGNLAVKHKGAHRTQRFVFDAEDRLLAVRTEGHAIGHTETRFAYDALGRRIAKTDREVEPGGHVRRERTTSFVWQGLRMVQELRATSSSAYVYSPEAPYTPIARVDQVIADAVMRAVIEQAQYSAETAIHLKPRVLHFHTDLVGAPLEVTDDHGELAWRGDYKAWGRVDRDQQQDFRNRIEQPIRYPGQYADDETGLHYNTFRYYDPEVGRFISQDPIGLDGGENLYAYTPNSTQWMDPLGRCATTDTGIHAFGSKAGPKGIRPRDLEPIDGVLPSQLGKGRPQGKSVTRTPNESGLEGHYHSLREGTELPKGLGIVHDGVDMPGGYMSPGHSTVFPTRDMPASVFDQLFQSLPWNYGGKI